MATEDLGAQLEMAKELNKVLAKQASLVERISSAMGSQTQMMGSLKDIAKSRAKVGGSQTKQMRALTSSIKDTQKASKDFTNELQAGMKNAAESTSLLQGALGKVSKFMFSWKGGLLAIFGGIGFGVAKLAQGFVAAFKGAMSLIKNTVKVTMGIVKGLIMAPFKTLDLMAGAASSIKRIQDIAANASAELRGMLGDFNRAGSTSNKAYKAAKLALRSTKASMFGPRTEGTAALMKAAGKLVQDFGPYQKEFAELGHKGIKSAVRLNKALGFTAENFQSVMAASKAMGFSATKDFTELELGIKGMADAGGMDIKTLKTNIMTFYAKLRPISGMSVKRIQEMAGQFTKLGIEGGKALGMFSAFDDLEQGAAAASKLTQSHGIVVDQMEMIAAGPDTGKRLAIVRKSMEAAGKDYLKMTSYQQADFRKTLSIDEDTAMKAFGRADDQAKKAIKKAADRAKKASPEYQAELLERINKSIAGIGDTFGKIMKPLEAFKTGFTEAFGKSDEGKKFLADWKKIQISFEKIGRQFGTFFANSGILSTISKSLKDFVVRLKSAIPLIKELLLVLFKDNPKSKRSAWTIITEIGEKIFGAYGGLYNKAVKGFMKLIAKFAPIVIRTMAQLGEWASDALYSFLDPKAKTGDSMMKGLKKFGKSFNFTDGLEDEWNKTSKAIGDSWDKNMVKKDRNFFKDGKKVTERAGIGEALWANIGEAGKRFGSVISDIFSNALVSALTNPWVIGTLAALFLGPTVLKAVGGLIVQGLAAAATTSITGASLAGAAAAAAPVALIVAPIIAATAAAYAIMKAYDVGDIKDVTNALKTHEATFDKHLGNMNKKVAQVRSLHDDAVTVGNKANALLKKNALGNIKLSEDEAAAIRKITAAIDEQRIATRKKDKELTDKAIDTRKLSTISDGLKKTKSGQTSAALTTLLTMSGIKSKKKWTGVVGARRRSTVMKMLKKAGLDKSELSQMNDKALADTFMKKYGLTRGTSGAGNIKVAGGGNYGWNKREILKAHFKALADEAIAADKAATKKYANKSTENFEERMHEMSVAQLKSYQKISGKDSPIGKQLQKVITEKKEEEFFHMVTLEMEAYKKSNYKKHIQFKTLTEEAEARVRDYLNKRDAGEPTKGLLKHAPGSGLLGDLMDAAGAAMSGKAPGGTGKTKMPKKTVSKVAVKKSKAAKQLNKLPADVLRLLSRKRSVTRMLKAGGSIQEMLSKMIPVADNVSESLNSKAIPALEGTAESSHKATTALATTVVALDLVRDRIAAIQSAYTGIYNTYVKLDRKAKGMQGKKKIDIKTDTGTLTVNMNINVDSEQLAASLKNTPVVSWSESMSQ